MTLSTGFEKTTLVTEGNLYLIQRFFVVMELLVPVGLEQVCFFVGRW